MKKLWYLFLSLFLAFGIVACENKGDIVPEDPEPGPVGPTAAPISVVTDIAFERDGYQAVELSWVAPEEEYPITNYSIIVKSEGQEDLKFDFTADEIEEADGKQIAVIEGLEQPLYSATILAGNSYGLQKNGAQISGIAPFTLETMVMPTFAIVDEEGSKYLRLNNVNGSRNIFDHIEVTMKDSNGNVVFEGEAAASDDDLVAALDDKQANTNPVDILIALEEGVLLDESETYAVDYTIYAHPAIGGVVEEGFIIYEDVLDMGAEPASAEGSAENLGVGVEVQPLYFHFYSHGSKYLTDLEQAVITVPQEYVAVSEGSLQKEPKYASYKIYTGTSETNYELYTEDVNDGVYPSDGEPWYTADQIDPYGISELVPNSNKEMNLYATVWAGQAINTISLKHEVYPSYVRVEAFDKYGRMVAMGQRLCPTFSVGASQPDIQAHQPKWELLPGGDGLTYKLKASHLSAARAYARSVKWSIKDENGNVVAEDKVEGGSASGKAPTYATLINKEWIVEAKNFTVGEKYSVDYEIDYIPVYIIPGMDDQQPLDYNPETGRFTPTEGGIVENATGLDHDVRILRDYIRDENGNVKYRLREKDAEGNNVYEFKHESGDYRGWVAWMEKSVILTSEELLEAGATLENELTVPEENGTAGEYKINLKASVPKKMNTVNLSWDAIAAEDITKVVINDGSREVVVTEGGQYAWTKSDGRASIELGGVQGGPEVFINVAVYAGETLLDESEIGVNIFTLDNWEAPQFEWKRTSDGKYKFIVSNMANINYAFSHIIYDDVANSEKLRSTIKIYNTKNNALLYTLQANSLPEWNTLDWAAYGRWGLSMQDAWSEWQWSGGYNTSEPVKELSMNLLPEGTYRIEYEIGYVVNKDGFWSTSDFPYTETYSRPDVSTYEYACVAFPQTSPGLPPQLTDHSTQQNEHVLYCENRVQSEAGYTGDINVGKRKLVKVFVQKSESTLYVGSTSGPQLFLKAEIDEGKEDIYASLTNTTGKNLNSKNGLYESVKLTLTVEECEYDKAVISYNGKSVEVTDGSKEIVITDIKTPSVTFDVALYQGATKLISKSISTDVYTLAPAENQIDFTIKSNEGKYWILVDQGLSGKEWFFHDLSFNIYAKDDTSFANPILSKNVTKNGDGSLNSTLAAWASFGRASYSDINNSDYDSQMTEYKKEKITVDGTAMEGYFTGLLPGTDYVIKYRLRAYPQIYSHTEKETSGNNLYFFKSILFNNSALDYTIEGTVDVTTPGNKPTDGAAALNPIASVGASQYQAATVSWTSVANATGYEIWAGGKKVAQANAGDTSVEVTGLNDDSIYEFTVKAVGTGLEATTAKVSIFTMYHWTEPTFTFDGKRMVVSGLADLDKAGGSGYAYGGAITNDNDTSKSTIKIYKEGQLLYTLTNGTGQGTLTAWAGYGRWALNAQEDRKDWVWTKADGSALMEGETDVPAGSLPAGTYTLEWTIGYVVNKNANWATTNEDSAIISTREGASCIYHGPKDTNPSPNVLYTSDAKDAVRIFTKSGEATLTVQ